VSKLTHAAITARKVLKYGAIGFVAYLVLRFLFIGAVNLWKKLHPPPPPPPTVTFGKLPELNFPESAATDLSFRLETPTGGLPSFSDRATVYFMSYKKPSLLAFDRAKQTAKRLGFTGEPAAAIDTETYVWHKELPAVLKLEMNIVTGAFEIDYAWQNDDLILVEKNLPGNDQAIQEAKSLLDQTDLLTDDLKKGEVKISYLKAVAGKMVPAVSLSEANFVKLDFFRKPIEERVLLKSEVASLIPPKKIPTVTPEPQNGVVSFIFSGSIIPQKRIVKLTYNYFPVVYESSGTYPLKDISLAWEEVKASEAYVVQVKEMAKAITIRKIHLAYYDTGPQEFLQPVYVFEGDEDFTAYVHAVDANWVATQNEKPNTKN